MISSSQEQPDAYGFLDALVEISRHVRLLILVPLAIAALVTGGLYWMPSTFVSQAVISFSSQMPDMGANTNIWPRLRWSNLSASRAVVMLKSPVVLDRALSASRNDPGPVSDADRAALKTRIQVELVKSDDGLIALEVRGDGAGEAQAMANRLIDAWLQTLTPAPREMAEWLKWRSHAQAALTKTQGLLDAQKGSFSSIAGLGELQDRYVAQLIDIDRAIAGPGRELVVQAPTLPDKPQRVPYVMTFIQTFLAAAILLVMGVLIRMAVIAEGRDPAKAKKLGQVRASINPLGKQTSHTDP